MTTADGIVVGTLTAPTASGQTATSSGTLTVPSGKTISANEELTLTYHPVASLAGYASQTGTLASAYDYDVATATVTVASVSEAKEITISETSASFVTQTAVLKVTMRDGSDNALNATGMKISDDGSDIFTFGPIAEATYTANGDGVLYFVLPSAATVAAVKGTSTEALAALTVTFTATVGGKAYTATKTGYSFAAGTYYTTELTMAKAPDMGSAPAGCQLVDLGIEVDGKKILFASMNLGATSETDYGDYSAWGETEPYYISQDPVTWKDGKSAGYAWDSYQFTTDGGNSFTKYNDSDGKSVLETADDAAAENWGGDWRMPTATEFSELLNGTYREWVENFNDSGVNGYKFTNKTDATKYIFLPAAGYRGGASLDNAGSDGNYWSSSLSGSVADCGHYLIFYSGNAHVYGYDRYYGHSVRPVQRN